MVNSDDLAKRLEKIIEFYGISASAFADSIGVQRSSISHILSGRNKPSLDFVMKIIDTYPEVELYWLLNGKGIFPHEENSIKKNIPISTPNLFENQNQKMTSQLKSAKEESPIKILDNSSISRIVIFYKDGTFEEYKN